MNEDVIYLAHFGIKGQRWGVRRYQNSDGSLTSEGRKRYGRNAPRPEDIKKYEKVSKKKATNTKKYLEDVNKKMASSKEYKDIKKSYSEFTKKASTKKGASYSDLLAYQDAMNNFKAYKERVLKETRDDFARAYLKDMNYEDTKAGREAIKKYMDGLY